MNELKIFGIERRNEITRKVKVKTCVNRINLFWIAEGIGTFNDHTNSMASWIISMIT